MYSSMSIDLAGKWRTRFHIYSEASLSGTYMVRNCPLMLITHFPVQPSHYLVDVFVERDKFQNIEEILYFTLDVINEFVSQVSFVSYATAELIDIIAISPHVVEIGEEFEIAIFNGDYDIGIVNIENTDLLNRATQESDGLYINLLQLLKQALSTESLELRFLNLFATLDYIADGETDEKVKTYCPNCNAESEGTKATSRFIRELFLKRGIPAKEYNQIRSLRGKIAHGSGVRNMEFYSELLSSLATLESMAYDEVIKRGPLKVKRNSNLIAPIPITTIKAIKFKNPEESSPSTFDIVDYKFDVKVKFTGLKNAMETQPGEFSGTFGPHLIGGSLQIPPEAWPY